MARERRAMIRASEIGEYVYCARAWWLRRAAGLEPESSERRERGVLLHKRHGRAVAASGALIWAGVLVLIVAAVIVLWLGGS